MPGVKDRYFGSAGGATIDILKKYIENQDTPS